jgi:hypothetical protein
VSGTGTPLDLEIENPAAAEWHPGSLTLTGSNRIVSLSPATKVTQAIQASNELTLEAWITPASASQRGPARIATLSRGAFDRNLTLGQGHPLGFAGSGYEVRVRTSGTNRNGVPSVVSPPNSAAASLQHVVYTLGTDGIASLYIDGALVASRSIPGRIDDWDASFRLALGNELLAERPWLGTYHLIAIYDRALSNAEVIGNFAAGADAELDEPGPRVTWVEPEAGAVLHGATALRVDAPAATARVEFSYTSASTSTLIGSADAVDGDGHWSIIWDTTTEAAGGYLLSAVAYDAADNGNVVASANWPVLVRRDEPGRVANGLAALWDFSDGSGSTVSDVSGVGDPLDLEIADPADTIWGTGTLTFAAQNSAVSSEPASKVIEAVQASNAITLEAWITPSDAAQPGPARIVSISLGAFDRNVTLAHGHPFGDAASSYEVRLRTTMTNDNGVPSMVSPDDAASADLQHIVYTRDTNGTTKLYIDGAVVAIGVAEGDLSNWDDSFRLILGNEFDADRPWIGTYHLVAIYDRALNDVEVQANFLAGPNNEVLR